MNLTPIYILSQILIIMGYACFVITYQLKEKEKILLYNGVGQILLGLSYICLGAYTGFAMTIIAALRNVLFIADERNNHNNKKNHLLVFLLICILIIIFSIVTYNGFLSLMSVFATTLYTFSSWQKNNKLYKVLGIPISLLWIGYNIYIKTIFGVILEIALMISAIVGLIREKKEQIKNENNS